MRSLRGMSLIDVIVGLALMLIIFTGLIGLLRSSLQIAAHAKARSIATTLAESQIEFVRSLEYAAVGTVGGIPAGLIPQIATSTQNGMVFTTRTFIQYEDDPADGVGVADSNGIPTDYKRVKVSVSYAVSGSPRSIDLVTTYAPPGLETTTGGGTLRVNVVDATGSPVPGASVHIVNNDLVPAIDLTTFSNTDGVVFLPGAPTSTLYEVVVTRAGYSSAQTYDRVGANQNPAPGHLTVAASQTTTGTFAIDRLATLAVRTFLPMATTSYSDSFTSSTGLAAQSNTQVTGGALTLLGMPGTYSPAGSARAVDITPTYLAQWGTASATISVPAGTNASIQVRDGSGALLPDTTLPGNAAGFTGPIDLSGISTSSYPSLVLSASLSTGSPNASPAVLDWSLSYARGPIPTGSIPFTLTGTKTIGTTGAGVGILKTEIATSTAVSGELSLAVEWDAYSLSMPSHDVVEACSGPPYELAPNVTQEVRLMIASATPNALLVSVEGSGGPIAGASVTLTRPGFTRTVAATACGSAYFGNVPTASDYTVSATAPGFSAFSANGISVSSRTFYAVPME